MKIAIFLSITIMSLLSLAGCTDYLDVEDEYKDWQAASDAGEIVRGWIPTWVPKTATHIHQRHNLDSNALAFSFLVPSAEYQIAGIRCSDIELAEKPRIHLSSFPKNSHKSKDVKLCDGYFVLQSAQKYYVWKN